MLKACTKNNENVFIQLNASFTIQDSIINGGVEKRSGDLRYVPVISADVPCTYYIPLNRPRYMHVPL